MNLYIYIYTIYVYSELLIDNVMKNYLADKHS